MLNLDDPSAERARLTSAAGVRQAAHAVLDELRAGNSAHFALDETKLADVVDLVADVTEASHPDLSTIGVHSRLGHFEAGSRPRLADLEDRLQSLPPAERLRVRVELVITSVLLDAGAGARWRYREPSTGETFTRSEGLAVASFDWFEAGGFSSDPGQPLRADADRLASLEVAQLERAFQVDENNPLVGAAGRIELLKRLAAASRDLAWFPGDLARPGNLADRLVSPTPGVPLPAIAVLDAVLGGLSSVWPGRESLAGRNLGDVWTHSRWGRVPFHKLSQWLTYSLCDCLSRSGMLVIDLDDLTGLAEYRNGGLFVDLGVLQPKHAAVTEQPHRIGDDIIIEWRAATVALLDIVADKLRARWDKTRDELPLGKVLEGGTWAAGRRIATERRPDGRPPITLDSDGTVF